MQEPDFKALFESAPSCFMVLDPELHIVAVSDAYAAATLTERKAILGRHLFDVFPDNPSDPSASGTRNLKASLDRVLASAHSDIMAIQKYDVRRPDGQGFEEKYWSPTNFPVVNAKGEITYIIHRAEDVTELVRLKKLGMEHHHTAREATDHSNTIEKIRQSQRMEAMGQLAGGVAHDFNNILAVLVMVSENMLESKNLSAEVRTAFQEVKDTSERAAALTRHLLAFSRKQVLQPKVLEPNALISGLEVMLNRLLHEHIKLETTFATDIGHVMADPGQIEQVILNLVVNARDAMPAGGKITIETANATLDKGLAAGNPIVEPGEYVMIAIRDTGIGMDAAVQARLFEPFFTTKGVGRGTGLGLATVFGIVSQAKGTIWVYSEVGKGTAFKVYLPRVNEMVTPVGKTAPIISLGGAETLLVVEDQEDLRRHICKTLEGEGYTVFSAGNGVEALTLLKENPKKFHMIVTDVVMPEMGGRELAERAHSLNPKLGVLFLSGYTEAMWENFDPSMGEPHFLEKPFSKKAILTKIRMILKP